MSVWGSLAIAAVGAIAGAVASYIVFGLPHRASGEGCAVSAERTIAFSSPNDRVVAALDGPRCDALAATLTIRRPDGALVWTYAVRADWLAPEALGPGASKAAASAAAEAWSNVTVQRTGQFAAWPQTVPGVEPTADMRTPFDREGYEEIRARNLPVVCFATGAETIDCLFWDPDAQMAQIIYDAGA